MYTHVYYFLLFQFRQPDAVHRKTHIPRLWHTYIIWQTVFGLFILFLFFSFTVFILIPSVLNADEVWHVIKRRQCQCWCSADYTSVTPGQRRRRHWTKKITYELCQWFVTSREHNSSLIKNRNYLRMLHSNCNSSRINDKWRIYKHRPLSQRQQESAVTPVTQSYYITQCHVIRLYMRRYHTEAQHCRTLTFSIQLLHKCLLQFCGHSQVTTNTDTL